VIKPHDERQLLHLLAVTVADAAAAVAAVVVAVVALSVSLAYMVIPYSRHYQYLTSNELKLIIFIQIK